MARVVCWQHLKLLWDIFLIGYYVSTDVMTITVIQILSS